MRSMKGMIRAVAAPLVAGLALTAVLAAQRPPATSTNGDDLIMLSGRSGTAQEGAGDWSITGTPVNGLTPGASSRLQLRVTNPHPYDIQVLRVHVTLTPGAWTGRDGCRNTTANLVVSRWLGRPFLLRAHRTITVPSTYQVRMPMTVSAACQGATFPLTYTGYATKAARR
jgi:hypothetical protein